ncbi:MAG: heat-inducible transcriptional repressor HrcA [candidate division KSB1 bacterium]|jgi:heat-inducible transcriptional repressor|nr:heat-inducible transcriptional repressor HrcA [candidate division KSB1 bacterium]
MSEVLSKREIEVLESVIKTFIQKARPVGSRFVSKNYNYEISPATIRNVMMDLEEKGFITQPHTSAGRIPTDKGYRYYVDGLMGIEDLSSGEKQEIQKDLRRLNNTVESILDKSCKGLSKISNLIGIVLSPRFYSGKLKKIDVVKINENILMVILSIESGLVKTITMELKHQIKSNVLEETVRVLNERLHDLTLKEIQDTISNRMRDISLEDEDLIQQFVNSADKLFVIENEHIHLGGTKNLMNQPEFTDRQKLETILELIDDQKVLIHKLNDYNDDDDITIMIGSENQEEKMRECSLVTAKYKIGSVYGTLGVIGPTRMNYPKMISLVDYLAKEIGNTFDLNYS